VDQSASRALVIRSDDKSGSFVLPVEFAGMAVEADQTTIAFKHVGGKYFLSSVKMLEGFYTMAASREMIMLVQANTPGAGHSSASGSH
jgi:hypothetical protein